MARDFAGTTHRIDWANVFNTVSPLTISCWVYPDAIANISYLFASHNAANNAYAELFGFGYSSATAVTLFFEGNGSTSVQRWTTTFNPTTVTGAWHHALLTWDGGTAGANAHIYLDGTERTYAGTINGVTLTAGSGVWSVGNRYYSDNRNLDGRIGYIGVWNTALGTAEIAGLASGKSPDFYSTNLQFWSLDGDNYSNNISGAAGTLDGTTFIADPPIIRQSTAAQANQAQVSDAAIPTFYPSGGGEVNITVAQNNQAQVSDAAVLGVFTPIAPSQQNQAQKSDIAVLGVFTPVAPSQQNQAQVSDAATFGAIYPLTASQQNQAQVSDAAVITVSNPFVVDDIILEWVAVTQTVTTSQQNQAQVSDAVTLGAYTPIAPSQQNQAQVSDAVSLTAQAPTFNVTVAQNNQAQVSDAVTFGVIHPITAADNNQAQKSDLAILTSGEVSISAADNRQAQVSDEVTISAYYPITPSQQNQSQTSDTCLLGVIHPITVTDNNQAQVSDAATVTYSGAATIITGADNNQAQVMDIASLTAIYILAAVENNQAQKSDLAVLSIGGVIEHGARRLYGMKTRPTHVFKTRENLEVDD